MRLLCSSALLALWLPLGCSSDDGDDATSGGSSGKGGGDSAGGEPSTSDGGGGNATSLPACGENDVAVSDCDTAGDLCASAERCCRCVDFPSAPSCGNLWDCARPELNTEDCPENPPTAGTACASINLSCQYCLEDGPHYLFCGRVDVGSDEGEWNEGDGLSCNE
ncbi:MAG TPA: hypothetical protein VM686_36570 [Polyangiaceae bacterium]|nr:hypothetical protein [Polyangiaceae bacterium]